MLRLSFCYSTSASSSRGFRSCFLPYLRVVGSNPWQRLPGRPQLPFRRDSYARLSTAPAQMLVVYLPGQQTLANKPIIVRLHDRLCETRLQRFGSFRRYLHLPLNSADQSSSDDRCFLFAEAVDVRAAVPEVGRKKTLQCGVSSFAIQFR